LVELAETLRIHKEFEEGLASDTTDELKALRESNDDVIDDIVMEVVPRLEEILGEWPTRAQVMNALSGRGLKSFLTRFSIQRLISRGVFRTRSDDLLVYVEEIQ